MATAINSKMILERGRLSTLAEEEECPSPEIKKILNRSLAVPVKENQGLVFFWSAVQKELLELEVEDLPPIDASPLVIRLFLKEHPIALSTISTLSLADLPLHFLPRELLLLSELQELDASHTQLTDLPEWLYRLPLKVLNLSDNHIKHIPVSLFSLKTLELLLLDGNPLKQMPSEIQLCKELRGLGLGNTQIQTLPQELAKCTKLEVLEVAGCPLSTLPEIPSLKSLWSEDIC